MPERILVMVCMVEIYLVEYAPKSQKVLGADKTLEGTVGRGPSHGPESAEPRAKRLETPGRGVSKVLILLNKWMKQGHHVMESQGNSGQKGNSPCSAWNQGYNPCKRRGRSSIG